MNTWGGPHALSTRHSGPATPQQGDEYETYPPHRCEVADTQSRVRLRGAANRLCGSLRSGNCDVDDGMHLRLDCADVTVQATPGFGRGSADLNYCVLLSGNGSSRRWSAFFTPRTRWNGSIRSMRLRSAWLNI